MQCSNHLKQIGLAIHNYHDSWNGLPPSALNCYGPSIFVLLYPYIEQQTLYNYLAALPLVDGGQYGDGIGSVLIPNLTSRFPQADVWNSMGVEMRQAFASVNIYRCPSRRGGGAVYLETGTDRAATAAGIDHAGLVLGPQSDYAFVCVTGETSGNYGMPNIGVWYYNGSHIDSIIGLARGPFRVAEVDNPQVCSYDFIWCSSAKRGTPRDTFSRLADGTSNQVLFGEKHIPLKRLGLCGGSNATEIQRNSGDCSYLVTGGAFGPGPGTSHFVSASRALFFASSSLTGGVPYPYPMPLANPHDYEDSSPRYDYGFGSYHPGVCPFVMGDGAVRSVSVTTPVDPILYCLGAVNDGQSVAIP